MVPIQATLSTEGSLQITCKPTDLLGKPAALKAGTFAIKSDTAAVVADGVVSSDGVVDPNDPTGQPVYVALCAGVSVTPGDTCKLMITGDGDNAGGDPAPLSQEVDVTIVHPAAVNLGLSISEVARS